MTSIRKAALRMNPLNALERPIVVTVAVAIAVAALTPRAVASPRRSPSFVVDGVRVSTSAEVQGMVLAGSAGDATQETTIVDRAHHRTLSVIAVPFGTRPGTEDALPVAARGGARDYRSALHDYRARNGEFATDDAPAIALFGNRVTGELSQRTEHASLDSGRELDREVFTVEWVTEAGPRLWIVRARQFAVSNHPLGVVADFLGSLGGLTISSDASINAPTTVFTDSSTGALPHASVAPTSDAQLRQPPSYSDGCDGSDYDRITARRDWRHELGASYRGVPACGPRPAAGAPLIAAGFSPAAPSGVFQFDAVELSLRWMYLAYGTPPFSGNGDELFANYSSSNGGQELYRYSNMRGAAYPQPGDVLSYDTGGTGGHTAVVEASRVDARGNGWLEVMEQDASSRGSARLTVIDAQVFSNYGGSIIGWLSPRPYR